jgi:hypothetical protein
LPNVIVPRHSVDTIVPVPPRVRYSISQLLTPRRLHHSPAGAG